MTQRLRVALIMGSSTGGIGAHVTSLAGGLVERGHAVVVAAPAATLALFDVAATGATPCPVGIPPSGRAAISDVRRLRATLADVDVAHAHGLRAAAVAGVVRPRHRPALVVTWHNAVLGPSWRRSGLAPLERYVARRADRTLAASADLAARAGRLGAQRVAELAVSPPAAKVAREPAAVRAELAATDRALVVAVARLHPQKRLDVLVDAAVALTDHPRRPLVAVAGEGPLRGELERRIAAAHAPVRLLGYRDDADALIAAADVVVLPSEWEARSLVAQQALRAGRPLVTTPVGGLPELVGDAAVLVPAGDPAALAAAVVGVLDDPSAAAALAGRAARRGRALPTAADTVDAVLAAYRAAVP